MVAVVGVVFGDIGTSPLYTLQTVFSLDHHRVTLSQGDIMGVLSLVFWSITVVVSVKYVGLVMRADNDGEGGILALTARILAALQSSSRAARTVTVMAIVGAALFLGDSVITPAISVMSAVEGLQVGHPVLQGWVLPISVTILTVLFLGQRFGTTKVGRAFGPIMVIWFVVSGVLGVSAIVGDPGVLAALSPQWALLLWSEHPYAGFVAMGAVVLSITGAEALYADMGHFGAPPIRMSWFVLVLPALTLNYFGQGANLLRHPEDAVNPFFLLAPRWASMPLVVLATLATVIASQAVISGSFSVAQQAMRLGLLPRMRLRHTSEREAGQVYVPAMNTLLYGGVLVLIVAFRTSSRLATAYGLAVTGTLVLTTALFLLLAKVAWAWSWVRCLAVGVPVGGLELLYFAANLTKFTSGGWVPLSIATLAMATMLVWRVGAAQLAAARAAHEGPLAEVVDQLEGGFARVPGTAVFPHADPKTAPVALRATMRFSHVAPETLVIVTMVDQNVPHVTAEDRVTVDDAACHDESVRRLTVRVGFNDPPDVPDAIATAAATHPELNLDTDQAVYYVSQFTPQPNSSTGWLRQLAQHAFVWMDNTQATPPQLLHLPTGRTIVIGEQLTLP